MYLSIYLEFFSKIYEICFEPLLLQGFILFQFEGKFVEASLCFIAILSYSISSSNLCPYVSGKKKRKAVPTSPITAGLTHVLIPILSEPSIRNGQRALPIIPIALTHPYPKLLTLVG